MKHKHLAVGKIERIVLVGCGGTGSILAEHLARMIAGFRLDCRLIVVDGDTVEPGNIGRQNFWPHEIGQNKAAAMALRLTGQLGQVTEAVNGFVTRNRLGDFNLYRSDSLVITATDTLQSRRIIADIRAGVWLDVGNEQTHGQAVIGTTHKAGALRAVWWNWEKKKGYVSSLPDIAAINPAILKARKARRRAGCGQMPFAEQGFGINAMAALAAALLAKQAVVDGVITTAAVYFDTASGRMTPRLIDKELFRPWMRKESGN